MRILITGASGLLGLNLALELARDHTVFGVVNGHPLDFSRIGEMGEARWKPFEVIRANLSDLSHPPTLRSSSTDTLPVSGREGETRPSPSRIGKGVGGLGQDLLAALLDQTRPEAVIHCAALANLEACEADPALARSLNTNLPGRLARLTAGSGIRLVHISTDAVFDGQRGNYTEADTPNPLSVYARTKLDGELVVLAADPRAVVARVNLFGWSLTGKRSLAEFFINNLRAGKSMPGFTDVFFCPLLVNDLAPLLIRILEKKLQGLYHLVSSESLSKYQFGVTLARRFGFDESLIEPISVEQAGLAAKRSPRLTLKTDKLARLLGESLPAIAPALERFYTLYQQGYPQFLRMLLPQVSPAL